MEEERAKIRYELEQKQAEEDRRREAAQQATILRDQMEKLKLREKEVSDIYRENWQTDVVFIYVYVLFQDSWSAVA